MDSKSNLLWYLYHLDISRIPPQWKESLVKEYNSNNRSFIYWILSRYEDSPSPGTRSAALGAGSAVVNCDLLELENLTVVYNITLRQIKLFLTITKETCLLVHSSKNTQLVSGQGPGTTTGLTRVLCLNSQYLQPFVPSQLPPSHVSHPGPPR